MSQTLDAADSRQRSQERLPAGDLVSFRCNQMLSQFATNETQDMQQLQKAELNDNMRLAVQYRLCKKQILRQARDASAQL